MFPRSSARYHPSTAVSSDVADAPFADPTCIILSVPLTTNHHGTISGTRFDASYPRCPRIFGPVGPPNYFSNNETTVFSGMAGGSASQTAGPNYPTVTGDATSLNPSHRAAHSGAPIPTRTTGDQPASFFRFSPGANSHQRTIPDQILNDPDNPDNFNDVPYVPPRITQAELQSHPALYPRPGNVYDASNHDIQPPFEGGTSPAESHHSVESTWSTSSSSTSPPLVNPTGTSQYSQNPLSRYQHHYPAYEGPHRVGLEHVRYGDYPSTAGGSYCTPQGYGLDDILSPEFCDDTGLHASSQMSHSAPSQGSSSSSVIAITNQPPSVSTFSALPNPPVDSPRSRFPDAGPYLRQQLGLSAHEPVNLQSLPDPPPGEKPTTPLPVLIKLAIYGSPNKQLTLQEIYTELESRFQWFRDHKHEKAWKNSIRHNLSLNQVFKHVPRPITEPGKGNYWKLDVSSGEGYKRTRKRRPKSKVVASEEEEEEVSEMDEDHAHPPDSTRPIRSSSTPVEDANIEPGVRSEGHVVGEGRTRPTTRRTGGGSPYPSQSPRHQQGALPSVMGQDTSSSGSPPIRFGQSSFGPSSFPTYPQTRTIPAALPDAPFSAFSSSLTGMAPTTSAITHPQLQHVAAYDRTAHIPNPQPLPRPGIEYVRDPGGLLTARRVEIYSQAEGQPNESAMHSSPGSFSGSSPTRSDTRPGSET